MDDRLIALAEQREVILAPTEAAARDLRSAFDRHQREVGRTSWEPARALAWKQWAASLFADLVLGGVETRLLLNPTQEADVWARVIAADPETTSMGMSPDAVADLAEIAQRTFGEAAAYRLLDRLRSSAGTQDERIFARWAESFQRACSQRSLLPGALLEAELEDHARSGALTEVGAQPARLPLYDFARFTPTQQALLDALKARGVALHMLRPEPLSPLRPQWSRCETELSELRLAARWIRPQLEDMDGHPRTRFALVVPNLREERHAVEAVLRDELAPELHDVRTDLSSTPWSFAEGGTLRSVALAGVVLSLARWATRPLPLPEVSALLLSRYLGRPEDRDAATVFDAEVLRKAELLEPAIDVRGLIALARQASVPRRSFAAPSWLTDLESTVRKLDLRADRGYAEWIEIIRSLAAAAGWPGSGELNAAEFALTQALDGVLDTVATLDAISGDRPRRVSFATARHALERLLERTPARPLVSDAPLQVLTPQQLEGRAFDAVVFVHATDGQWPTPSRPQPLLSRMLQLQAGVPGAHPELADAEASRMMAALLERVPKILFTCAREDADGELRPSPLLAAFGVEEVSPSSLSTGREEAAPLQLEVADDPSDLPPLPPGLLRGGATVLKNQAACGFLAFAEQRLRSRALEERDPGFDARESGSLLHGLLQAFWERVRSQRQLAAMSAQQHQNLLEELLTTALSRVVEATAWSSAYVDLTRQRLLRLLTAWLEQESKRSPFTVLETEKERVDRLGPIELRVRVDRIDAMDAGGLVLVDYKTGRVQPSMWEGPRPDDPQLPLYAVLAGGEDVRGVLFANVRTGKDAAWSGVQSETGIFGNGRQKTSDLETMRASWRTALEQLAQDFAAGRATIDPKDVAVNCGRCAQRLLCRRDAAALREADRPDDAVAAMQDASGDALALEGACDG